MPPEERALKTVSIRVTKDQRSALQELAEERWITMSEVIDMALEAFLEKAGHHPVVLNLPDDIHASLTKVAPQAGNKKDIPFIVMQAIERYLADANAEIEG